MKDYFKYAANRDDSLPPQWLCVPFLDEYNKYDNNTAIKVDTKFNGVVCWLISLLPCLVALGLLFGFK